MTSLYIVSCLLFLRVSSQCKWTVFDDDTGQNVVLDLSPLNHKTFDITDAEQHHYYYSVCQNSESCNGNSVMTKQTNNYGNDCYILGRWNSSIQPTYQSINGGTWTFIYLNGESDCGNPVRAWSPTFVCAPDSNYNITNVTEVPGTCFYQVLIQTKLACADWNWTTTTTLMPEDRCIFRSEDQEHILNISLWKGTVLSKADENIGYLYYMYSPCVNSINCSVSGDDRPAMAYIFDGMNFECKTQLAEWEYGFVEPTYIISKGVEMWQFNYTGETCNESSRDIVFMVEWYCNESATTPDVVQSGQIATCVYQMRINSWLACM
eukprot:520697_1